MPRQQYVRKPQHYWAIQYDGTNFAEMTEFCPLCSYDANKQELTFSTGIIVEPTSWIMYDNAIVFSMMTNDQFAAYFSLNL